MTSASARDACLADLRAMVGFDTVNRNISGRAAPERDLARHLESRAHELDLSTRRLPVDEEGFNLLVSVEIDAALPWILFESHLDTVSVAGMTIDPFAARVEAGRVWGRGACDTKGSGAAMLHALSRFAADGGRGDRNAALVFTLDEEVTKTGIRAFCERQLPELGWAVAGAVVGEPTGLRPVIAHTGVDRRTILTRGVAAHSSDPSRGRSAIRAMMPVIEAIEARYIAALAARHPLTGKAQASINQIRGGVQPNIIPESCEITLDRRLVPGEDPGAVEAAIEAILDDLRRERPDLVVEQRLDFATPALDTPAGAPFVGRVRRALESLGLDAEPRGVLYCTDASDLAARGIPCVVLGPGDIAQAHTRDEWLAIDDLHRAADAYGAILRGAAS